MNSDEMNRLLAKVARLYYERELTQGEIASRIARRRVMSAAKLAAVPSKPAWGEIN